MATTMFRSESDDDLVSQNLGGALAKPNGTGAAEGELVAPEVIGDAPVATRTSEESTESEPHAEIENPVGAESGEEVFEASRDQLAAEAGEESAFSDLRGIEGFAPPTPAESFESAASQEMPEVGEALEGETSEGEAEFGFLAALVPMLVSSVGPAVAKAVSGKLKPSTRKRVAGFVGRTAGAVGKAGGKSQILALLAKLMETAEAMPVEESSPPVEPELVATAVAAIESIIGTDDRVRITATTAIPWRRICALRIHFPNGKTYRGTGFFIGPRTVATAGHCVFLKAAGGWARRVEVIPGANGTAKPFGEAVSTQFRSVSGWVTSARPASDYGCIVLPSGAFSGRNLGSFGFAALSPTQLLATPAVVAGYPGDKPFAEAWGMGRKIKTVLSEQVQYEIDTMGGQSGAPVYIKLNGQRCCGAIHNYGGSSVNSATRITKGVFHRLLGWSKL